MAGRTKEGSEAITLAAFRLVNTPVLDAIEDESERQRTIRLICRRVIQETGCSRNTARQHVYSAIRQKRHPNYDGEGGYQATLKAGWTWGGTRLGAGRKVLRPLGWEESTTNED